MRDADKARRHRDKAAQLNKEWRVGARHVRYHEEGYWYALLKRFPAALFDPHGYIYFATEAEYKAAPMSIGKQISVKKPGISALSGYVRVTAAAASDGSDVGAGGLEEEYTEGRELFRLHRRKERNRRAVQRKKEQVQAAQGKLLCEVCDFDFAEVYGNLGAGFAECHHRIPLANLTEEYRIRLSELAIVCANCHRMLHCRPQPTVKGLRTIVMSRRERKGNADILTSNSQ